MDDLQAWLDRAEAQRDRLAAALREIEQECRQRLSWSGVNPRWLESVARAALADVPNDRARRRDEAYRAMVDFCRNLKERQGKIRYGLLNAEGREALDRALALARQVEEA